MSEEPQPIDVEIIDGEMVPTPRPNPKASTGRELAVPFALLGLVALLIGWSLLRGSGSDHRSAPAIDEQQLPTDADQPARSVPPAQRAVELYVADPGAAWLTDLFHAIGGIEGITLASPVGAFDLVRFDPLNPDRLLAANRSSYGIAENQGTNELWQITADGLQQDLWAPGVSHDFVHFNADGTAAMWVNEGDPDFGPRTARVLDGDLTPITRSAPMFASRFTVDGHKVFALTGDGNYGETDAGYVDLIADDAGVQTVLADGSGYEWIDDPVPGLLVAYPRTKSGRTAIWDTDTLKQINNHPLAGRSYQRVAVSGNGKVAVGITFDDQLEEINLESGDIVSRFGKVDPVGIDQPLTLNNDGTIAITVDRGGRVTMWWVGDDTPVMKVEADAGQPRWVSDQYGARFASAVAFDSSRVALRLGAVAQSPTRWIIIDTNVESWIRRACDLAGRCLD